MQENNVAKIPGHILAMSRTMLRPGLCITSDKKRHDESCAQQLMFRNANLEDVLIIVLLIIDCSIDGLIWTCSASLNTEVTCGT